MATPEVVAEALQVLNVRRLVLAIHDASFPASAAVGDAAGDGGAGGEVGRGSPYSAAGHDFFHFVRGLGFTGVQLGPQGWMARANPSPYDAMLFSRHPGSIALAPLWSDEVRAAVGPLAALIGEVPASEQRHADHARSCDRHAAALGALWRARGDAWAGDVDAFAAASVRAGGDWLARDCATADEPPARYRFEQWLAHRQHDELRALVRSLGLTLYGDLQIGVSHRDRLALGPLFLDGYAMGAPPSRTNPEGQPWGYPLFDPAQYDGAAGALFAARIDKLLGEYDALRIDHPHGLVDPWVYPVAPGGPGDEAAQLRAVQAGTRLFSSPDLDGGAPLAPLARLAIARPEQLDHGVRRWDDGWVRSLDEAQIDRYGALFERLIECVRARRGTVADLLCEVLSTWPYPLRRVMEREGLGRMLVTQKARLHDPGDVYRSENAGARDWIMVGNHDTPPLWRLVGDWRGPLAAERARHLAERLEPEPAARADFARELAASPGRLATAMFAELLASPAQNVSIFFSDLLGYRELYNVPGTVSPDNWRLRVAPDYQRQYALDIADGAAPRALSLPRALALAVRADRQRRVQHADLLARLDALADEH